MLSKLLDVGKSWRTPIKHAIMREFVDKECRAGNAPKLHWIKRMVWIDLTAGNAVPTYDAPWSEACSPGILASRAARSNKPVVVDLYERNPDTYGTLLDSLGVQLPALGYQRAEEHKWRCRTAEVRAWRWDGRNAGTDHIAKDDVALVLNDPNSITEWAMDRRFTARLERATKGVRVLSCLGFNVGGGKRAPLEREGKAAPSAASERGEWYGLIGDLTDNLPDRHDLMLVAFKRDKAQWAYLFSAPHKWRPEEERLAKAAFTATGEYHDYELAWFRKDREKFGRMVDRLILTKTELRAQTNPMLPLDSADPPYRTYKEYLKHPRFLKVRAEVFARANGKCERCGLRPPVDPHHLRYPPWGTFDVPENLIAICRQCHCEIHGKAS